MFVNPFLRRRSERPATALPASSDTLFTITGGRIVITQIIGEVTVAVQNQACNAKLIHNVGTGTDLDICAVLNIANDEVGTLYGVTGLFSDALIGAGQALVGQVRPFVLKPGSIDLSVSAENTGSVKWSLYWAPIDGTAFVAVS